MFINLVTGGNGGGATAGVTSLNDQKGDLKLKTVNNNDLLGEGNIEIQAGVTSVNGQEGAVVIDVPTKVSQLENDANFQTQEQVTVAINDAMSGATGGMEYVSLDKMSNIERKNFYAYFLENLDANGVYHGNKWPFILKSSNYVPATALNLNKGAGYLNVYYYAYGNEYYYENISNSGSYGGVYEDTFTAKQKKFNIWEFYENSSTPLKLDNTDSRVSLYGKCFLGNPNLNGGPTDSEDAIYSLKLERNGYVYHCWATVKYQTDNHNYGYFNFIFDDYVYKYKLDNTSNAYIIVSFISKTPVPNGNINSSEVSNIKVLTQAEYDAIDPKDAKTLYMIKG